MLSLADNKQQQVRAAHCTAVKDSRDESTLWVRSWAVSGELSMELQTRPEKEESHHTEMN
jgi:hypothetical protein